ncbi:hypothetical protein DICVIV_02974 [Dictyocaulus viviparus]|uniref:Uncharacterized protein n=1 Tax=Dictyocaulus viviparus TaxID=29172 RepID=A0A0D8Y4A2_DICVI|nr:hypothetical protein DICVIV_02974 [Dictyocaulus viviparus]
MTHPGSCACDPSSESALFSRASSCLPGSPVVLSPPPFPPSATALLAVVLLMVAAEADPLPPPLVAVIVKNIWTLDYFLSSIVLMRYHFVSIAISTFFYGTSTYEEIFDYNLPSNSSYTFYRKNSVNT